MMDQADQLVIEHLRASVERYRRLAAIHESFGETQKAADSRALADLQEERARRVERRLSTT